MENVNASRITEAYYVRITSPREGTKIEVNENTNQLMKMLRHGDKGLTGISDENSHGQVKQIK
ncbi:hypothetical protein HanRHA438_Chr07g0317751 [Helianthus annuus]|nr:hypothetical protein HanRHA438_Chr07g0317751 [Helianthus annuus]